VRRALIVVATAALTAAAVGAVAPKLGRLAGGAAFVPADHPVVVLDREITREFGFANPVLWVLEARTGSVWTTAMLQLAALTETCSASGRRAVRRDRARLAEHARPPGHGDRLRAHVPHARRAGDRGRRRGLRRRVDGDRATRGRSYADGRAAMVVANFRADVDPGALGAAALALGERHRDDDTAVWATGAPVLAAAAPAAFAGVAWRAALLALAGAIVFAALLGVRVAGSALIAAALAAAWLVTGTVLVGSALPWALWAVLPTMLVAAAVAVAGTPPAPVAAIAATGVLGAALVADAPVRALWLAAAAGAPAAVLAGWLLRGPSTPMPRGLSHRVLASGAAVIALVGVARLGCSLGLIGYAERYLPAPRGGRRAVRRLFPPPASLAVRVRGAPGFVTAPEVLHALMAQANAASADPAVRSAMSIADVVRMVHRAFNDERPEFFAIPDDAGLVGRYLALAYSPTFRRFLDRGFTRTALWVQIDGERPADIERVAARLHAAAAARPVPGATVDPPAGDAAVLLVMARLARHAAGSALAPRRARRRHPPWGARCRRALRCRLVAAATGAACRR
jgi:hypothetical protein